MSQDFGLDRSGNNNHWAVNNTTYGDQMVDSPTNNFCTWNPLSSIVLPTLSEGNLKNGGENNKAMAGTFGVSTGKWYWEINVLNNSQIAPYIGATKFSMENDPDVSPTLAATSGRSVYRFRSTPLYKNFTATAYADDSAHGLADYGILGLALDLDNGTIKYYVNNTLYHTDSTIPTDGTTIYPFLTGTYAGGSGWNGSVANFGQDSSFAGNKTAQGNQDGNDIGDFYYAPPTDYLALCTSNMSEPSITPREHFETQVYSGNGSNSTSNSNLSFQPDFLWFLGRSGSSATESHIVFDVARGTTHRLMPDVTSGETTDSTAVLVSFDSDGWTMNSGAELNASSTNYVNWAWKAGGSGSSNTNGSINTTATSANTDAGFSISTWTGNATSGATVGHGLSKAPEMIINKQRSGASNWYVYHKDLGATKNLELEVGGAANTTSNIWNDQEPTSTVFYLGNNGSVNGNTETYVTYCFHSVEGYSKVGSYTGNQNNDGTFVYCGFRPAWVMLANTTTAGEGFIMFNNKSDPANVVGTYLTAYGNTAEQGTATTHSSRSMDFVSNGFKLRGTSTEMNESADKHVFIAIAETPFKYANAR